MKRTLAQATEDIMFKHPLQDISFGLVVSFIGIGTVSMPGCGGALPPQAQAAAQYASCRLNAVRVLPEDTMQVTPADIQDVVERLQACRQAKQQADSGAP